MFITANTLFLTSSIKNELSRELSWVIRDVVNSARYATTRQKRSETEAAKSGHARESVTSHRHNPFWDAALLSVTCPRTCYRTLYFHDRVQVIPGREGQSRALKRGTANVSRNDAKGLWYLDNTWDTLLTGGGSAIYVQWSKLMDI